ncbi:PINc domain-containing protein [Mycena chlorophos]|uniref:PINc domain-containing protein n=1 Tax=Mycena chlorophos TaxID=658473 RepID=A0A8H6S599_MYCCL|nr:PINc domain-containing protein [Mycena chlorophos]
MVSPSTSTATSVASIPEEYDATPSTGNIPIPPSPDPSGPGFMQEIDGWIENIGRLVHALEEQHQQRHKWNGFWVCAFSTTKTDIAGMRPTSDKVLFAGKRSTKCGAEGARWRCDAVPPLSECAVTTHKLAAALLSISINSSSRGTTPRPHTHTTSKQPTTRMAMADKKAMSRALGAAFLNHQVEQLEKQSAASQNWRSSSPKQQRGGQQMAFPASKGGSPRKKNAAGVLTMPNPKTTNMAPAVARLSLEDEAAAKEKDADVVVVDSSVLVHALHQVKRWCREGREEIVIVPLEALNTLDLLKKGTSPIAQRARAASRILEAQVGSNPRIRVQQDAAFVPWDAITFPATTDNTPEPEAESAQEWVRRTICCARWEIDEAVKDAKTVRLAILAPDANAPIIATADAAVSKHESRAAGALVSRWAAKAGVDILPVSPSVPNVNGNNNQATANNNGVTGRPRSGTNTKRRPNSGGVANGNKNGGGGLVERPAAALALEGIVGTGGGPGVIRVLARGERLDSGP